MSHRILLGRAAALSVIFCTLLLLPATVLGAPEPPLSIHISKRLIVTLLDDPNGATAEEKKEKFVEITRSLATKEIAEHSHLVTVESAAELVDVKRELERHGITTEPDPIVLFASGSTSPITDPNAATWFYQPTELARRTPAAPQTPVAFDYTRGSDLVGILTVDTQLDEFEHQLWSSEITRPQTPLSADRSFPHGTSVSYIIHGRANSTGSVGVCPGCSRVFVPAQLPDDPVQNGLSGFTFLSDVITNLTRALASVFPPPRIINISFGLPLESPALNSFIKRAYDQGISIVAAAGNESSQYPLYPASSPLVVGVGSSGEDSANGFDPFVRSDFSNKGVDIMAPGNRIHVPDATSLPVTFNEGFGTSYATPFIAGTLGLMHSLVAERPNQFPQLMFMSPSQGARYFESVLSQTATDIESPGVDSETGSGLVNVRRALERLLADGFAASNPLATNLTRAVTEWGTSRKILQQASARIATKSPETEFALNIGPWSFGSCGSSPHLKVVAESPRLSVDLRNSSLNVTAASADMLEVTLKTDIEYFAYSRLKIFTGLQCLLHLPGLPSRINLSADPEKGASPTSTFVYRYRLGAGGYELVDSSVTHPPRQIRVGLNNLPSFADSFIPSFDVIGVDLLAILNEYLEAPFRQHFGFMVDQLLKKALPQERLNPFALFEARSGLSSSGSTAYSIKPQLIAPGNFALHSNPSHVTNTAVRASRPPTLAPSVFPALSVPSINPPLPSRESEVTSPLSLYDVQLAHLFAKGAFDFRHDPILANPQIVSGTMLRTNGVNFGFSNVTAANVPTIELENPSLGTQNPLRFSGAFRATINVEGRVSGATIVYTVPLSKRSQYKGREIETQYELDDAFFEERVVPVHTSAETYIFFDDPTLLEATPVVATPSDIEMLFHFTYGHRILRTLGALSSSRNALNVNLGETWGCLGHVSQFINFYYRQFLIAQNLPVKDLLELRHENNCFNLNLGLYAPSAEPAYTPNFEQITAGVNFALRKVIQEPRADFNGEPSITFESRILPSGALGRGFSVNLEVGPRALVGGGTSPEVEIHTSLNGLFRSPTGVSSNGVKRMERVRLVEQLWQLNGSLGTPEEPVILVPQISGRSNPFSVIGIGRHTSELARQDSCMPTYTIEFNYHRDQNRPPTGTKGYSGNYVERPVHEVADTWQPGNCLGETWVPDPPKPAVTQSDVFD